MSFSITLPDGSKRDFDSSITVGKLASSIATSLGKAAVAGKVNGQLRPLDYVLDNDAEVAILTDKDEEALDVLRASAAFVFDVSVFQGAVPNAFRSLDPQALYLFPAFL